MMKGVLIGFALGVIVTGVIAWSLLDMVYEEAWEHADKELKRVYLDSLAKMHAAYRAQLNEIAEWMKTR